MVKERLILDDGRLPHAGVCMTCNGFGMLWKFNGAWFCHRCLDEEQKSFGPKREGGDER